MPIFNALKLRQTGSEELQVLGAEFDLDPDLFESNLPTLSFYDWVGQIDPALGKSFPTNAFPSPLGNVNLEDFGYTAYAQMTSTVRAVRVSLSQVATTVGFLRANVPALASVFKGPAGAVADGLNVSMQVLENPGFTAGINALTAVPIVGWIIRAVVAVAKLIIKIIDGVRKNRANKQQAVRDLRQLMPLAKWDPDIDAAQVRMLGQRIKAFDCTYAFFPRYGANSPDDFYAEMASGDPLGKEKRVDAWRLLTRQTASGLGFIPGTQNLHGAIEMPTGFCSSVKDIGDFFPTARQVAYQLWQTILSEDAPALFTVPARRCAAAWESYLMSALAFTVRDVSGWSCARDPMDGGSVVPKRSYMADSGPYPTKQVDPNDSKHPKTVSIRGEGHRAALLEHLRVLFNWTDGRDTSIPNADPRFPESAVKFERSTPGRALENLHQRQLACANGLLAAYVDDSRVRPGGGAINRVPRWPAIAEKGEGLWDTWDRARRDILASNLWREVDLDDVPGGPNDPYRDQLTAEDRAFYQALVDKGPKQGSAGPKPKRFGRLALGAAPPPPPPEGGYEPDQARPKRVGRQESESWLDRKSVIAGGVSLALLGAGWALSRRGGE